MQSLSLSPRLVEPKCNHCARVSAISMASADRKRARLEALSRYRASLPTISHSALGKVLQRASKEPPPKADRNLLREARDRLAGIETPYGAIHQYMRVSDDTEPVEICHPAAWLYAASQHTATQNLLNCALGSRPHGPIHIICYADEVTPGNAVAHKNRRKSWLVYYSFLELGPDILCHEDAREAAKRPCRLIA